MSNSCVIFKDVSFAYPHSPVNVLESVSFHLDRGWTGVVGANGAGKTTLMLLAMGTLEPEQGAVKVRGRVVYCPQRTDDPPALLDDFLDCDDRQALALRHRLGVGGDYTSRWPTLSHGERKRAQIGVALWQEPEVLLVDEPTNHIDGAGAALLLSALQTYRGTGLLVCHDRTWLDDLCGQCLFCIPPTAVLRPGTYSEGAAQALTEARHAATQSAVAKQEVKRLRNEARRRGREASRADGRRSKRRLRPGDSDGREKIDRARNSGKDGQAGRLLNQLQGRMAQAEERAAELRTTKTYAQGIWMTGEVSKRDALFRIAAGELPLGPGRSLHLPDLLMRPTDRIALTGPNGAGKSSLLHHVLDQVDLDEERLVYLPQEIDRAGCEQVLTDAKACAREALGRVMTAVRRLGSDPKALLASSTPSPGETRKLLLALGIARQPHLIIMDEPTNHLDLPSIECLETALVDCPCGLLLVSHDERFLEKTTTARWRFEEGRLTIE